MGDYYEFQRKITLAYRRRKHYTKAICKWPQYAPSTIGGYVQGISEPDFETLKRIALYFNVSADYLLNIPENKINNLAEEELLRVFRSMTNEQQQLYIEQGKVFVRANNQLKAKNKVKSS